MEARYKKMGDQLGRRIHEAGQTMPHMAASILKKKRKQLHAMKSKSSIKESNVNMKDGEVEKE